MISFQGWAISISLLYLLFLFFLAYWVEKKGNWRKYVTQSAWIYALSISIYCTAWTFYGSIGSAASNGIQFLAIYLGPTLMMPIWYLITKKLSRIVKMRNISTFADLISIRYSQKIGLGMYITFIILLGIIPYISLQIKAISQSFQILMQSAKYDTSLYTNWVPSILVVSLGLFIVLFASKRMDTNEHHSGIVASVAFESIFKLVSFLIAGIVITYFVFSRPQNIYQTILNTTELSDLLILPKDSYMEWASLIILSAIAFLLLPRQFQVSVLENYDEKHLKNALWQFPLYLFLINLFVIPIAFAGKIILNPLAAHSDYFILELPMQLGLPYLGLLVFLGGFSAAVAMVVLETLALSNMLSNNFLIPLLLKLGGYKAFSGLEQRTLLIKHFSVGLILAFTLFYFNHVSSKYSLVSIGLISFVLIAQFFPTIFGALYLKHTNQKAVIGSISAGFLVWLYTLILPSFLSDTPLGISFLDNGPMGIQWLKPQQLFGLEFMSPIVHSFFWSMLLNLFLYFLLNFLYPPTIYEKQQAHLFVDIFKYTSFEESRIVLKETAQISDIKKLLERFMGEERTRLALNSFAIKYKANPEELSTDPRLIPFVEKLLSKIVGTVSARVLLENSLVPKELALNEMLQLIEESKEVITLNRELNKKQFELEKAKAELEKTYNQLLLHTELKDEFLATVSHELKSPITSISAFSEILKESHELNAEEIAHFSSIINKESARITRLINQLLDMEKYESGSQQLSLSTINTKEWLNDIRNAMGGELQEKNIDLIIEIEHSITEITLDSDKMMQVLINLISNAIKFSPENEKILLKVSQSSQNINIEVADKGKGIGPEYHQLIFEKFFQARHQSIKKPKGSGLGLAISKKIVMLHKGEISVKSSNANGTVFLVSIPKNIAL